MRATLSPAFTGSKMRQMFQLVSESVDQLLTYLDQETLVEGNRSQNRSPYFVMALLFDPDS